MRDNTTSTLGTPGSVIYADIVSSVTIFPWDDPCTIPELPPNPQDGGPPFMLEAESGTPSEQLSEAAPRIAALLKAAVLSIPGVPPDLRASLWAIAHNPNVFRTTNRLARELIDLYEEHYRGGGTPIILQVVRSSLEILRPAAESAKHARLDQASKDALRETQRALVRSSRGMAFWGLVTWLSRGYFGKRRLWRALSSHDESVRNINVSLDQITGTIGKEFRDGHWPTQGT